MLWDGVMNLSLKLFYCLTVTRIASTNQKVDLLKCNLKEIRESKKHFEVQILSKYVTKMVVFFFKENLRNQF